MLLAQMLSCLLGALVGFFVATTISQQYTAPFRQKLMESKERLAQIESNKVQYENDRNRLSAELRKIDDQLFPPDKDSSATTNEVLSQLDAATRDELMKRRAQIKSELDQREAERSQDKIEQKYQEERKPEYSQQVLVLDISSAAVLLILSILGYMLHPLMLLLLNRSALNWERTYGQDAARSPQALIGFFAGINLAVVILLAIFNTFETANTLLGLPFARLVFGALIVTGFGFVGSLVGVSYFVPQAADADPFREFRLQQPPKLLDTSVLIDGRVLEIATAGFLDGCLVVPNSVLRELQALSDSADGRKRAKGRRGLELVRSMQEDPRLDLRVFDDSALVNGAHGTDESLIIVAQAMGAVVVTNDYNLNRVAAIREVRVVNINGLANAVKTSVIPGEMLEIEIADRGKQRGQGVGYLPDGTMVVVEDGEPYIKQTRTIKVTSVTQTAQGRLIFGRVDLAEEEAAHA